jgi:DNA adenine methylase
MSTVKPPFPYFGGKQRIARQIIEQFPEHRGYIEPYAGSLSVLFAKEPTVLEVVNDLNGHLVTFWRVLRDEPEALQFVCDRTPHARGDFNLAKARDGLDDLEVARRVWVLLTQGRSAIWHETGWRHYKNSASTTGFGVYMNGYRSRLHPAAERIRDVQIECRDGIEIIQTYGAHADNLLYVDPPYLGEVRGSSKRYGVEMTNASQHEGMLEALNEARGPVVLSGYSSGLYEAALSGWNRIEIAARTQGADRVEVVWTNRETLGLAA